MNYELAKELKDAGFPLSGIVASPTLEELIEACGRDFRDLEQYSNTENGELVYKWQANAFKEPSSPNRYLDTFKGRGSTPTEAVAKLWLALQVH